MTRLQKILLSKGASDVPSAYAVIGVVAAYALVSGSKAVLIPMLMACVSWHIASLYAFKAAMSDDSAKASDFRFFSAGWIILAWIQSLLAVAAVLFDFFQTLRGV